MNRRAFLRNALALLGCASPAALLTGPVQRSWAEVAKEMQRSTGLRELPIYEGYVSFDGGVTWREWRIHSSDVSDPACWRYIPAEPA